MTPELIQHAISEADQLRSKLTEEAFEPGGFTSPKIRHLMNNLGAISTNYLEIGTHRGALSVATVYGNELQAFLIDNWSEFNESDAREEFFRMREKFMSRSNVIEQDCFAVESMALFGKPDLYLYDAAHDIESQKKALTYYAPYMNDTFIFCVDDYDWDDVKIGTRQGIEESGVKILDHWALSGPDWHNGFAVFLMKK